MRKIFIILFLFLIFSCRDHNSDIKTQIKRHRYSFTNSSDWNLYAFTDSGYINVRYSEKYGRTISRKVKLVFENDRCFRIIGQEHRKNFINCGCR